MLKKKSQPWIARSVIRPFHRVKYSATKRMVGKTNHWQMRNKRTLQKKLKQQEALEHKTRRRKGQRRGRSNHLENCRRYKGNWKKARRCRANRGRQKNIRRRGRNHRKSLSLKCKTRGGKKRRKRCRKRNRKRMRGSRVSSPGMQLAAKAPVEMSLPPSQTTVLPVATASHTDQSVSPSPNQVQPKSNTNTNTNTNTNSKSNSLQVDGSSTKKPLSACEEAVLSCCSSQWSTFGETARCFELNNCAGINFIVNVCIKLPEVIERL